MRSWKNLICLKKISLKNLVTLVFCSLLIHHIALSKNSSSKDPHQQSAANKETSTNTRPPSPPPSRAQHTPPPDPCSLDPPTPLITLFTSFKYEQHKAYMYRNTLRNRALLRPYVKCIVYVDREEINTVVALARKSGCDVYEVPQTASNASLPVLRAMFIHAQQVSKTRYYGYSNADILFTEDLVETLNAVQRNCKIFSQKVLVIGIRTNVNVTESDVVDSLAAVRDLYRRGRNFYPFAMDYFITTYNGFPWRDVPDFVIGRPDYDRWLTHHASLWGVPTVAATPTLTAVHQTRPGEGDFTGSKHRSQYNRRLLGPDTRLGLALTSCSLFSTRWAPEGGQAAREGTKPGSRGRRRVELVHRRGRFASAFCYKFSKIHHVDVMRLANVTLH